MSRTEACQAPKSSLAPRTSDLEMGPLRGDDSEMRSLGWILIQCDYCS